MTTAPGVEDPRIPPIGEVSQNERLFRSNWVLAELRSPSGVPLLPPEHVAQQGRRIMIVDLREEEEMRGPLGHIPGSIWSDAASCDAILEKFDKDAAFVFVSRGGERASAVAKRLEDKGMRFVAAMMGGIIAWKQLGFGTVRSSASLAKRGAPSPLPTFEPRSGPLTREDVVHHLGDASSVRFVKMAALLLHGRLSCVDGRDHSGIVGTPGGDAGELALTIAAAEKISGRTVDAKEIARLLADRLDALGRFYVHSDVTASNALIAAIRADQMMAPFIEKVSHSLEWRVFFMQPPPGVQPYLLEHLLTPANIGCGHLRAMMLRPEQYGLRPGLTRDVLAAFWTKRWEGATEIEYRVLGGGHAEGAVLQIGLEEEINVFSTIPLISPEWQGRQVFVVHPPVIDFLRREYSQLVAPQLGVKADALYEEMHTLGTKQAMTTLGVLAKGLPVYEARFGDADKSGEPDVTIEARGSIPG